MIEFEKNDLNEGASSFFKKNFKNSALEQFNEYDVYVGFPSSATKDGESVAEYAKTNDYGMVSRGIPSRPFLRTAVSGDRYVKPRLKLIGRLAEAVALILFAALTKLEFAIPSV